MRAGDPPQLAGVDLQSSPWLHRLRIAGLILLLLAVALVAMERAATQRVGTDFHVFWQAGYDFAHHRPLYQPIGGARTFIYPPFAAQLFQVFGLFPLKLAAGLFYFANVLLIPAAAVLTRDLVSSLHPEARRGRLAILLAVLFAINFILNNLNLLQINLIIFVMSLLGVGAMVKGRELAAAGWIATATAMKLTPAFLGLWLLIRGQRRAGAAAFLIGISCVALPVLQRGWDQGLSDLTTYYQSFLRQFAQGHVDSQYTNQSLAAMVFRAVSVPPAGSAKWDYAYLPSLERLAPIISTGLGLVVLVVLLAHLLRLRRAGRPFSALEVCSVFLAWHLLSPITWKAHLVTLVFIAYTFLSLDSKRWHRPARVALVCAWLGIAAIGLSGRDLVGDRIHHYLGGYSVFVWVMLGLFAVSVAWSQRPPAVLPRL